LKKINSDENAGQHATDFKAGATIMEEPGVDGKQDQS